MIQFDARLLAAVAVAQANDPTRPYLCGVYFQGHTAVATNGHIMTVAEGEHENSEDGVIMPVSKRAITAMTRRIGKKAEDVVFMDNKLSIYAAHQLVLYEELSEAIDWPFPDYKKIIPNKKGDSCAASFGYPVFEKMARTRKILGGGIAIKITGDNPFTIHFVDYQVADAIFSVISPLPVGS